MSFNFTFKDDVFSIRKLNLPSRYYYFQDFENYIKLLNVGEGIFPKDRIKLNFSLENSNLVLTSESATKVYKSNKEYGINYTNIKVKNSSNLEFLNDELILHKQAKYMQLFKIKCDETSTFFYSDILSHGRSYEKFDFDNFLVKNSFYINNTLEYIEKFHLKKDELKTYIEAKKTKNTLFAKIYIKTNKNEELLELLKQNNLLSFSYSKSKIILLCVISSNNMSKLKIKINNIWKLYRNVLEKRDFDLGKN